MTISRQRDNQGFTLIELISIIVVLGIIAVVATAKWPGDMHEEAATKEFKRAIRYAQHQAMTRAFTAGNAWGLEITSGNQYTIRRQDGTNLPDFSSRSLLDDNTITISDPTAGDDLWFNGLGEPISSTGAALGEMHYIIAGSEDLTVCPQTGYVVEAATCP